MVFGPEPCSSGSYRSLEAWQTGQRGFGFVEAAVDVVDVVDVVVAEVAAAAGDELQA